MEKLGKRLGGGFDGEEEHPADRVISLKLHRAKILSRMRDFIWTIRAINKKTTFLSSRKELF